MRTKRIAVALVVIGIVVGFQPAWAEWVVNDPTTTAQERGDRGAKEQPPLRL